MSLPLSTTWLFFFSYLSLLKIYSLHVDFVHYKVAFYMDMSQFIHFIIDTLCRSFQFSPVANSALTPPPHAHYVLIYLCTHSKKLMSRWSRISMAELWGQAWFSTLPNLISLLLKAVFQISTPINSVWRCIIPYHFSKSCLYGIKIMFVFYFFLFF